MNRTHILGLILLLTFLCSCKSDDNVIVPEESDLTTSYRVKAISMLAFVTPDNENDDFEVFGSLNAKLLLNEIELERRSLWQRTSESYERLIEDQEYVLNSEESEQIFKFTEEELKKGIILQISAKLFDYDFGGSNDELIDESFDFKIGTDTSQPIEFKRNRKPSRIGFSVRFTIERIID